MQDLNDLRFFVQVVDHGGFAPAARALGLQKSRLSRRIALLEERLGVRLLQRSTRRFAVTEIGRAYYARCLAMLVEAEAAQAVIDGAGGEPRGTVRLACPTALVSHHIGPLLAAFMQANPLVTVHLESTNRRVDVIGEGFDLAIRVRRPPLAPSELVMRRLYESVHCLVASPALLRAAGVAAERWGELRPGELQGLPSLDQGPPNRAHAWDLRHAEGMTASIPHQPRLVTDDLEMLQRAALAGIGVAELPLLAVGADLAAGRLVDLLPAWRPPSWLVHALFPTQRGLLPSVRALLDFLAERCQRDQRAEEAARSSPRG